MKVIGSRQLGLLAFAALAGPAALLCSGITWPAVLLGVSAALLGMQLPAQRHAGRPQWVNQIYLLWLILLMAKTASLSQACFQDETGFIPLILLALAAAACRSGIETCGRIGAVLWPAVGALLLGLLGFAAVDFRWGHFVETGGETGEWETAAALLLSPLVLYAAVLKENQRNALKWGSWAAAAVGLGASVVSCGVLGPLREPLEHPLYDMVRGVSVLGIAERLEALLSVVLCISFFLSLCLLCAAGKEYAEQGLRFKGRKEWWVVVAALALSRPVSLLPEKLWLGASVAIGIAIPFFGSIRAFEKKRGISKNNA